MGINEKFLPRKQLAASLLCLALDLQRLTQYFQDLSKTVPTNLVGVARWIECRARWFSSQWGDIPGLWARFPVGGMWEATTHWCFSPSLPLSLKINEWSLLKNQNQNCAYWTDAGGMVTSDLLHLVICPFSSQFWPRIHPREAILTLGVHLKTLTQKKEINVLFLKKWFFWT